jgi:hypothetical protein
LRASVRVCDLHLLHTQEKEREHGQKEEQGTRARARTKRMQSTRMQGNIRHEQMRRPQDKAAATRIHGKASATTATKLRTKD